MAEETGIREKKDLRKPTRASGIAAPPERRRHAALRARRRPGTHRRYGKEPAGKIEEREVPPSGFPPKRDP